MDLFDEKEKIHTLLHELIKERRELTKQYYELKERLNFINRNPNELTSSKSTTQLTAPTNIGIKKTDIEYQKYKLFKVKNETIPYDKVARQISSILKETDIPVNAKYIFEILTKDFTIALTYKNLTNNILPRAAQDSSLNIEKAYRGYYQYRQK